MAVIPTEKRSCLFSLGANLGNAKQSLITASEIFVEHFGRSSVTASHLYRTPPVGGPEGQDDFFNAVLRVETNESVFELWDFLRNVEHSLGRQRNERWEARRIDVDLLLAGDERVWTPHLKVPHPRMNMRKFILDPAAEIAAELIDPVSRRSVAELASRLEVRPYRMAVLFESSHIFDQVRCHLPELSQGTGGANRQGHPWLIDQEQNEIHPVQVPVDEFRSGRLDLGSWIHQSLFQHMTLLVALVASPDPETVAWEDYASPWARALRLWNSPSNSSSDASPNTPQALCGYLLAADSPKWAAHEIKAAFGAMKCVIHRDAVLLDGTE